VLFQSWPDPFEILFTLPLAAIGAIGAMVITGSSLRLSSLIRMPVLVRIVVADAIVMLEFVIMLGNVRGYSTHDALIEGALTQARPILMTAFAAMLALIPLSFSDLGEVQC
jgi:HAE1 family hydrophobic/amphiphilic exporter-1